MRPIILKVDGASLVYCKVGDPLMIKDLCSFAMKNLFNMEDDLEELQTVYASVTDGRIYKDKAEYKESE